MRASSVSSCPARLLYVSDAQNDVVHIYPVAPRPQPECGRLTGLDEPTGLALDGQGDLFVVNTGSMTIEKFKPGHTQPSMTIQDANEEPIGVSVNASGLIAVTNLYAPAMGGGNSTPGSISLYRPNGALIGTYSDPTAEEELFPKVDAIGNVYTTFLSSNGNGGGFNEFPASNYSAPFDYSTSTDEFTGIDLFNGLLYVADVDTENVTSYELEFGSAYEVGATHLSKTEIPFEMELGEPIGCALLCGSGNYPLYVADPGYGASEEYITNVGSFVNAYPTPNEGEPLGIAITRPM